jgi:hypothetical protein
MPIMLKLVVPILDMIPDIDGCSLIVESMCCNSDILQVFMDENN